MQKRLALAAGVLVVIILSFLAGRATAPGSDAQPTTTLQPSTTVVQTELAPNEQAMALCAATKRSPIATVENDKLGEISGVVASSHGDGAMWVHNDSGDTATVYGVNADGSNAGAWTLSGVDAIDIEDIARGPGPKDGETYLYLADIGDNKADRDTMVVYRFVEPTYWGSSGTVTDFESFSMNYTYRPHNAESFIVDPISGDWYVITKATRTFVSQVFTTKAPAQAANSEPSEPIILDEVTKIDLNERGKLATAADVSPNGETVVIRTYEQIIVYPRDISQPLEDAFNAEPCVADNVPDEEQGEAVGFVNSNELVTISEGSNANINVLSID